MKPYYCYIENININHPETTNDLVKNPKEKPINKEISMLFKYLKLEKPCQQRQPGKNPFINNLINKTANIFISYRKYANYKLILKPKHDRIIIISKDFFEQLNLIKIESLLVINI